MCFPFVIYCSFCWCYAYHVVWFICTLLLTSYPCRTCLSPTLTFKCPWPQQYYNLQMPLNSSNFDFGFLHAYTPYVLQGATELRHQVQGQSANAQAWKNKQFFKPSFLSVSCWPSPYIRWPPLWWCAFPVCVCDFFFSFLFSEHIGLYPRFIHSIYTSVCCVSRMCLTLLFCICIKELYPTLYYVTELNNPWNE